MKPKSLLEKLLLPLFVLIGIVVVGLIIWKGLLNNQGAALYNVIACPFNSTTPQVRMYSPNGLETYFSGQTILAKWGRCHIPTGTTGTLVLTKISGDGPAMYGPYTVTSAQTTYSIPIPTLPGVFNGVNGLTGVYRATISYGATTDDSDNIFYIQKTPFGVKFEYGPNTGAWAANGQTQASLWVKFPLRAVGGDVYLDKDVLLNAAASTLGGQQVVMKEYLTVAGSGVVGAPTTFDAQITTPPILTVVTPNVTLLPGGTYKIPAGQEVIFKISVAVHVPAGATAPYHRAVSLEWKSFGLSVSDSNGNLIEPNYAGPSVPVAYLDLW